MVIILSSILTVFSVGLSTGGLMVSRRIDVNQSLFIVIGISFFLLCYLGMFIGGIITSFVSPKVMSMIFGLSCLALIAFLIWKYDPRFGFVKQEPASFSIFLVFFLLLGIELAILEISIWLSIVFTLIFIGGLFLGFMFIYRVINLHRSPRVFVLIPLVPLFFIGLFKLI